jgi:hypothetical protein
VIKNGKEYVIKNGKSISFCLDVWLDGSHCVFNIL